MEVLSVGLMSEPIFLFQIPQSFAKRDHMLDIQKRMQAKWDSEKAFEVDAKPGVPKFLGCFPYPYMNGRLHLGHAFTATKTDFATR